MAIQNDAGPGLEISLFACPCLRYQLTRILLLFYESPRRLLGKIATGWRNFLSTSKENKEIAKGKE
jgi:hypothetical protein